MRLASGCAAIGRILRAWRAYGTQRPWGQSTQGQGLARTRLYTNQRFAENIALYAALGYRIDHEEPLNGGVAVHMSKTRS